MSDANGSSDIARAWAARADKLAAWTERLLVNRTDRWGGYWYNGHNDTTPPTTKPWPEERIGKDLLTPYLIGKHYRAPHLIGNIVGLHTSSPDGMSKWCAVDIDVHEKSTVGIDVTWPAAKAWYDWLVGRGFKPLLTESNGKGGYHLRVLFAEPVDTARVFDFVQWVIEDWKDHGFHSQPETFPKQRALKTEKGCGNWLRLPGRHHKRDFWSRAWNGDRWLEGNEAIDFILALTGDSPSLIPQDLGQPAVPIEKRIKAYLDKLPTGKGEGEHRDDDAFNFACWLVRDMQQSDSDALSWLEQWDSRQAVPKGRERLIVIIGNAHQYGQNGYGSGLNGDGRKSAKTTSKPPPKTHEIGDLGLTISTARKTKTNALRATILIMRAGQSIDQIQLTSSPSSRKAATSAICLHLAKDDQETRSKVDILLGQITVEANQQTVQERKEGTRIAEIVTPIVLADFGMVYRTDAGLYSERQGRDVRRHEFVVHTPNNLVDAASEAVDAPLDPETGILNRHSLIKTIQSELGVIWSDLVRTLPPAADAPMAEDTQAAKQFRAALWKLWTITGTWERDREGGAVRSSLISRTVSDMKISMIRRAASKKWMRILNAVSAWWRTDIVTKPDGEIVTVRTLAMRHELQDQMNVRLPGVIDQESLTKLGTGFGVIQTNPVTPNKLGGGSARLSLLSLDFSERLFAIEAEDATSDAKDVASDVSDAKDSVTY